MTTWQMLATYWAPEPTVIVGCVAAGAGYAWLTRLRSPGRAVAFSAGLVLLLLALISPLDSLGDEYLFSAHMVQHLLLILTVPPLLILGIPPDRWERLLAKPRIAAIERVLRMPVLAWCVGTFTLWIWHLPALYDAALENDGVHVFQHVCFLVAASVFWWPIVSPLSESRIDAIGGMLYILAAEIAGSLLSIIITFAPAGLYPAYSQMSGDPALVTLIRDGWGLAPAGDQQLAGLLMWVPGSAIYLAAVIGIFARWHSMPDEDEFDFDMQDLETQQR